MSDEVKTCKIKEFFQSLVKAGAILQEPMNYDAATLKIYIDHLEAENAALRVLETYKQEYRLAAAANKQLADALDKAREENKMLRLQMFAFVRNAAVLPVGVRLHKSEQEITDKTFETIEAAKAMLDVEAVKAAMNLATNKGNRFDNAD